MGDIAVVDGQKMTVSDVAAIPLSAGEAREYLGDDYLVSVLMSGDWAYAVVFEGDTSELTERVPVTVNITTSRVAPITLILKDRG